MPAQVRGGDGLVHHWLGSLNASSDARFRRVAAEEGHVRQYWVSNPAAVASLADADEASWFSRAALYLALYDEVSSS